MELGMMIAKSYSQRLDMAYEELMRRINRGAEFPDAVWHCTDKFAVSEKDLRALYDEEKPC